MLAQYNLTSNLKEDLKSFVTAAGDRATVTTGMILDHNVDFAVTNLKQLLAFKAYLAELPRVYEACLV